MNNRLIFGGIGQAQWRRWPINSGQTRTSLNIHMWKYQSESGGYHLSASYGPIQRGTSYKIVYEEAPGVFYMQPIFELEEEKDEFADHNALVYWLNEPVLNGAEVSWARIPTDYDYRIWGITRPYQWRATNVSYYTDTDPTTGRVIEGVDFRINAYSDGQSAYSMDYMRINSNMEVVSSRDNMEYPPEGEYEGYYYYRIQDSQTQAITDSELFGGVKYDIEINPDTDLTVGNVGCGKLTFTTNYQYLTLNQQFEWKCKQFSDSWYYSKGLFTIAEIKKVPGHKYTITAYDDMYKFDKDIKSYLDSITYPITVRNLLAGICNECGVAFTQASFVNSDIDIQSNPFGGNTINARTILSYIAAVAGGFIVIDKDGYLNVKILQTFSQIEKVFDNTNFKTAYYADYQTPLITKVKVSMSDNDVGIVVGTGDSVLSIPYNAIFYNGDTQVMTQYVTRIYNQISAIQYTPMTIDCYEDFGLEPGDRIALDIDGGYRYGYIFSKSLSNSGVTLECTGDPVREIKEDNQSDEVQQLVGKFHTIENTVNLHKQVLGDLATGEVKTFTIDAHNGVMIEDEDGNVVKIDGASINANRINAQDLNLSGRIAFNDLNSDTQHRIESSGHIYRQATEPEDTTVGAYWFNTDEQVWYTYNGSTWEQTSNPYYIQSTYIDAVEIRSPQITGNNISVNSDSGGAFEVKKAGLTLGYMGAGSSYDSAGEISEGIILANNSTGQGTYLQDGDNFVSITPTELKMSFGYKIGQDIYYRSIIMNDNGAFYDNGDGETIRLCDYARFV